MHKILMKNIYKILWFSKNILNKNIKINLTRQKDLHIRIKYKCDNNTYAQ